LTGIPAKKPNHRKLHFLISHGWMGREGRGGMGWDGFLPKRPGSLLLTFGQWHTEVFWENRNVFLERKIDS
jgi:hypothetical protein